MRPLLRRILSAVAAGEITDGIRAQCREALDAEDRAKKDRRRLKVLPRHPAVSAAKERKQAQKEKRLARLAEIRPAVALKWGGRCGVCCLPLGGFAMPWHLHHVLGGGLRRHAESPATCVPLCAGCHHNVHDGRFLDVLRDNAAARGLGLIVAALDKRIAKVEEARRAAAKEQTR